MFRRPAPEPDPATAELLVLMRELVAVFGGSPDPLSVLDELVAQGRGMAAQFKTNEGHTLRDAVNALTKAAVVQAAAAETAALATARLEVIVGHLDAKATLGAATGLRIEEAQASVKADLDCSHERADIAAASSNNHGAAGDAFAQSAPAEPGPQDVSTTDLIGDETHERP